MECIVGEQVLPEFSRIYMSATLTPSFGMYIFANLPILHGQLYIKPKKLKISSDGNLMLISLGEYQTVFIFIFIYHGISMDVSVMGGDLETRRIYTLSLVPS